MQLLHSRQCIIAILFPCKTTFSRISRKGKWRMIMKGNTRKDFKNHDVIISRFHSDFIIIQCSQDIE